MTQNYEPTGILADQNVLQRTMNICARYHVDPLIPIEAEQFFDKLLRSYPGNLAVDHWEEWLESQIETHFRCVHDRPNWIQGEAWQFHSGQPMLFVGQLEVPLTHSRFHDDGAIYTFMATDRTIKSVFQIY